MLWDNFFFIETFEPFKYLNWYSEKLQFLFTMLTNLWNTLGIYNNYSTHIAKWYTNQETFYKAIIPINLSKNLTVSLNIDWHLMGLCNRSCPNEQQNTRKQEIHNKLKKKNIWVLKVRSWFKKYRTHITKELF